MDDGLLEKRASMLEWVMSPKKGRQKYERRASTGQVGAMQPGASVFSGVCVMANTLLGSGMLGLPSAYARCGYVVGTVMLLAFGCSAAFGLHLLSEAGNLVGRPASFYGLAEAALPGSGPFLDLAIAIKCFGVATSYLIVVSDTMPDLMVALGKTGVLCNRRFWIVAALTFVGPLAFMRNLSGQRYQSYVAVACVIFVVFTVAMSAWDPLPFFDPYDPECEDCSGEIVGVTSWEPTLVSLPVFVFSYTCHQNIISITNELQDPTTLRTVLLSGSAMFISLVFYLTVAISGYLTFGSKVLPDILKSYSHTAVLPNIARAAIAVVVACGYPLQVHPTRGCVLSILKRLSAKHKWDFESHSSWWFNFTSIIFICVSTALAMVLSDLGVVLRFVGATGSTIVQYIVPGASYFVLTSGSNSVTHWLALGHLIMGLLIMSGSLILIFLDP